MKDYPVRLGSMLFTLVEPRAGFEVEYNRWYERDHFYAGCLTGPGNFAGRRYVATAPLKRLRYPADSPVAELSQGSYLAVYWIVEGQLDTWNRWAVDQVHWLHANGRMFAERDHVHTLLYDFRWGLQADPEGVPPEIALDHPYQGLVAILGELTDGTDLEALRTFYTGRGAAPADQVLAFTPVALAEDAPQDIPREDISSRFLLLAFCRGEAAPDWEDFVELGQQLTDSGLARVLWASPFLPTVPGTDIYAEDLR